MSIISYRIKFNSPDLLKSIVKFIRKKQAMWCRGKIAGDFTAYRHARNEVRFTIRQFHSKFEQSLLQTSNRKAFLACK